jgi:dienelactone hydrolase
MRAAIVFASAFLVSTSAAAAPLSNEQQARCAAVAEPSFREACEQAYSTPVLQMPGRAEEGSASRSGSMAIFKPAGNGPFPALVIMHTCDNIDADQTRYWVRAALERGQVAFVLDSFTQRGAQRGTCNQTSADYSFPIYPTRARDGYDALRHLATLRFVDRSRISAIGFSQGGRIAYMMQGERYARMFSDPGLRFRALVSVYGRCRSPLGNKRWWVQDDGATPLLSLLGGKDADGDAAECLPRFEALKRAGRPIDWHVYPNAAHSWDYAQFVPARQVPLWGVSSSYVRMEYDPRVTDDSRDRTFAFISR